MPCTQSNAGKTANQILAIYRQAGSESWLLTEPGYNHAIGSYFYRHGMSITSSLSFTSPESGAAAQVDRGAAKGDARQVR
jgi:hypothetical protein